MWYKKKRKQEKAFWKDRWRFSNSIFQDDHVAPDFSSSDAHCYFSKSFTPTESWSGLPDWVFKSTPSCSIEDFDMSPITSTTIRNTLRSCSKSSSPGDDQISYYHLWHLPSTHAFLAILFNRILSVSSSCPPIWCSGKLS